MNNFLTTGAIVAVAAATGAGTAVWVDSTHPEPQSVVRTQAVTVQQASQVPRSGLTVGQIYSQSGKGVGVVQTDKGLGTGFVIDADGHVITNAHVVLEASQVSFELPGDLGTYDAEVLGIDKSTDVAVLRIEAPSDKLFPLKLAAAGKRPAVGEQVVAIGNPLGEEGTVTSGIVSAVSREIDSLTPNIKIYGAIQTDAAINHGNSGGPLIDTDGEVIGINSQILSENNGNIGIGFAIPIGTARSVADQIISTGAVAHTWLGIEGNDLTPDVAGALSLTVEHGVIVGNVVPDSPAADAGIKGGSTEVTVDGQPVTAGGDIIVEIAGEQVTTFSDLAETIASHEPGDEVQVKLIRDGRTMTLTVTLGER